MAELLYSVNSLKHLSLEDDLFSLKKSVINLTFKDLVNYSLA